MQWKSVKWINRHCNELHVADIPTLINVPLNIIVESFSLTISALSLSEYAPILNILVLLGSSIRYVNCDKPKPRAYQKFSFKRCSLGK